MEDTTKVQQPFVALSLRGATVEDIAVPLFATHDELTIQMSFVNILKVSPAFLSFAASGLLDCSEGQQPADGQHYCEITLANYGAPPLPQ